MAACCRPGFSNIGDTTPQPRQALPLTVTDVSGDNIDNNVSEIQVPDGSLTVVSPGVVLIDMSGGGGGGGTPDIRRATMFHAESHATAGAAIQFTNTGSNFLNYRAIQFPASAVDEFTNGCYIKAGTYYFKVYGDTGNDRGKVDWYMDADVTPFAAGDDWYSASSVTHVIRAFLITVPTSGWHKFTGKVNGKNGSSSDYRLSFQMFTLFNLGD